MPALQLPVSLPDEGILVGYDLEHEHHKPAVGFALANEDERETNGVLEPILYKGGGHLLTIAPTGAGKGVNAIIPTLLRYPGSVIVIDPKGENYAVTARRRREMGQRVVLLDPFLATEAKSRDTFNPLDLIDVASPGSVDEAAVLAELIAAPTNTHDPFWENRARQLITGILLHVASARPPILKHLSEVRYLLNQNADDVDFTAKEMRKSRLEDVRMMASIIDTAETRVRASIISTAQQQMEFMRGRLVSAAMSRSSFPLEDVTSGEGLSIYIVIPPEKLESHKQMLRLWVGALMVLLLRRRHPPALNTLFILDEAAQLGPLGQLRQAITLLRGYGLQTWSFWQDLSQLAQLYPNEWETMLNNCRVVQAFGFTNLQMTQKLAGQLGFPDARELLKLVPNKMLLMMAGNEPMIVQRPSYLTDPCFRGQADPNPFHSRGAGIRATKIRPVERHLDEVNTHSNGKQATPSKADFTEPEPP
jgi:type IV secretion system protein VirD4